MANSVKPVLDTGFPLRHCLRLTRGRFLVQSADQALYTGHDGEGHGYPRTRHLRPTWCVLEARGAVTDLQRSTAEEALWPCSSGPGWHVPAAMDARGRDPDVLDGTSVEDPAEMDFAIGLVARAAVLVSLDLHLPAADELPIQAQLFSQCCIGARAQENLR
jgi:hypothetical protein